MLSFSTPTALAAAPTSESLDNSLRKLLIDRVHDWTATGLLDLTHLLIVQAEDTEADILEAVAFSPLVNPLGGRRFGSSSFQPHWDWLEKHNGWFELIFTVGNDGFAFVLFVQDQEGVEPELLALCRTFAEAAPCAGS